MARLTVDLKPSVKGALRQSAKQEFREPEAQAALLITEGLTRRGLLSPDAQPADNANAQPQPAEVRRVQPAA